MVSNMAKDNSNGQTEVNTLVILYTIIYEDMVHTHGKMADVLLANTRTIKCMEVGLSLGRMVGNTQVNTKTARKKVSVSFRGQVGDDTEDSGNMEYSMGMVY